jgi:hypothetical protein
MSSYPVKGLVLNLFPTFFWIVIIHFIYGHTGEALYDSLEKTIFTLGL